MRILILGAAGFIGSHLCEHYLDRGDTVVALDNLLTGRYDNLAKFDGERFSFLEHDLCKLESLPGDLDAILHFASPASPVDYLKYPLETLEVGAQGTKRSLELAKEKGCRFLLASTSEVYGDPLAHPQVESYWGNVNSIGPRSVYDEAKRYAEALTMAYHRTYGLKTRIVRIFNTYGPRMKADDGRAIPNFAMQALKGEPITIYGDGTQTRSFCYVKDLVEGIARLLESDYSLPVNLGNPGEFTMIELAKLIMELLGKEIPLEFCPMPEDDPRRRKPDISLAEKLLSWQPRVSLKEGLEKTLSWFSSYYCKVPDHA